MLGTLLCSILGNQLDDLRVFWLTCFVCCFVCNMLYWSKISSHLKSAFTQNCISFRQPGWSQRIPSLPHHKVSLSFGLTKRISHTDGSNWQSICDISHICWARRNRTSSSRSGFHLNGWNPERNGAISSNQSQLAGYWLAVQSQNARRCRWYAVLQHTTNKGCKLVPFCNYSCAQ